MLDSNTDRSWFMIGAVVVGALIIGLVTGWLPEMWDQLTGKFSELIGGVQVGMQLAPGMLKSFIV